MARSAAAGVAMCLGAFCAADSHAQQRAPRGEGVKAAVQSRLGDMLLEPRSGRRPAAPAVARYVIDGKVGFTLDRRSSVLPLLQFEGSNEVWVLQPKPAPKGDTIYKNEFGEVVLRAWGLGGLTVFTDTRPEGAAATLVGAGRPIQLPALVEGILIGRLLRNASARAGRATGQPVGFVADDTGPESAALIVDAANVAVEAFERLAQSEKNKPALRRIGAVVFFEGEAPSARLDRSQLIITVDARRGFAGRPSSETIMKLFRR